LRPFDPLFVVHGLGVWKHDEKGNDTKLLESMFDFNFRSTQGPFSLHSSPSDAQSAPQNVHLFNLATFLSRPNVPDKPGIAAIHKTEYFTTTRAYRVFQRRGNKLSLLARTDWEHPPRSRDGKGAPEWIVNEDFDAFGAFLDECELTNNEKRPIHGVIIKDLIKGVITETLIRVLAEKYADVPWFVSTKRWNPPWLNILSQVKLKLLLIPPIAANTALAEKDGLDAWIAPTKAKPTWGAMKCIGEIENTVCPNLHEETAPIVAVCPREGSIFAKRGKQFVVYQGLVSEGAQLVGWATAFFSTLCACVLRQSSRSLEVDKTVDFALDFASRWADSEASYLKEPDARELRLPERLQFSKDEKLARSLCSKPESWEIEWRRWTEATATHGIISSGENRRIELWRGMTAVNNYICFDRKKRKKLSRLAAQMREVAKSLDNHSAVQLVADPGSGKSHLVTCLAAACDLRMLSFNISQLNRREDIMSCFDTIVTTQATDRQRPLLVFFDEINCKIANQHVYDAFLSPLEESVYVRGGLKFHINPCLWVFAGTSQRDGEDADPKYADFKSRLTMGVVELGRMSAIEKAYLGAQLVRSRFADVRRVSQDALEQFAAAEGDVRELRNLVHKLHDVQNSQVSKANFLGGTAEPAEQFVDID
jgi:hypothetical protein